MTPRTLASLEFEYSLAAGLTTKLNVSFLCYTVSLENIFELNFQVVICVLNDVSF